MSDADYAVMHWRVTEDGLTWKPCGPECAHKREPDVTGVRLTAVTVRGDQIEWDGDGEDK